MNEVEPALAKLVEASRCLTLPTQPLTHSQTKRPALIGGDTIVSQNARLLP
jgi:hypothetical protein